MTLLAARWPTCSAPPVTRISYNLDYPLWQLQDVLLPLFAKHYTRDSLRETIESANHVWCAYEHEQCLGCALMTDVGSHGGLYVILFGVKESAQGLGIGRRLLETIIDWARRHEYTFIYLHTGHDNARAIRMYEKAGFKHEFYQPTDHEPLPQFGSDVAPMVLFLIDP
jgi:ribosomal protein S18 acetylase RimI-like enzyme